MTDHKDNATATATWQDNHSGKRGHQLMTKKLADAIPALGANENARDYDEVLAPANCQSLQRLDLVHHGNGPRNRNVLRPGGRV